MAVAWIDPIYDRSQADVDRIKELNRIGYHNMTADEKTEWLLDSKGALNTSDLTRIENNVQILSDVFELDLTTYDGNIPEVPMTDYYANLRSNAQEIRDTGYIHADTPTVPSSPLNAYSKWNDIEKILYDVHKVLTDNFFHYAHTVPVSGEYGGVYAGETIGLLL